ncbi:MAG: AAA family ATPase [Phycisphaerales bacterium]|nr:AAA family ATPase [Phycisphaerales bacterium]
MSDDLTQRIYAAFAPAPLTADDADLYVQLDDLRGDADIVERMAKKILLADGKPTCQVLAGHKGSGKSTELYRLQHELETGDGKKMFVVFCGVDEDIDRNDVDFPDLLVAIVRQMARQLREEEEIKLQPGYFKSRLEGLKEFLTREVDFDKFDLETGLGSLGVTIKGSPDARADIRKAMEPDSGNLLNAANDVISEAVSELLKKRYGGLVILIDDLDKMTVRPHEDAGCSTAEYLFVQRAAQLTGFNCHVVYTMPISLAYSHQHANIKANYGGHVPLVPMTKIATQPPESKPYKPGVAKFQQIVDARLKNAGPDASNLFENDAVRGHLIQLSGGQPSELMTLVREAIIADGLPIKDASLERAQREGRREYARQLRAEHWAIIKTVRDTGWFERTQSNEPLFRELLESRAILQYVNDTEWYGLNPMVTDLDTQAKQSRKKPSVSKKSRGR